MSGQYFATYVEDLEQDPFDAIDFVERVAWRMTGGADTITDPVSLKNKFEEEIGSLQMLCDQFQVRVSFFSFHCSKISILEHELNKEKREYVNQLQRLYERNAEAIDKVKQLDSTMQSVSTKVVHLGDQLESLLESADLVQKLYSISQELSKEKFATVQARIAHRYEEVERLLIDEFGRAQRDEKKMAEVAKILSEFKGYSHCVARYVEYILSLFRAGCDDVYGEALQVVKTHKPKIEAIFPSPTAVVQKLILSLYTGRLKEHIYAKLRDCKESDDREGYLIGILRLNKELDALHFIFNSAGAMLLLCDLNEYRKCVSQWRLEATASRQFESLHALANLLVVLPENLTDAAHSPMLADVDHTLIQDFLKLRQDYKNLKINAIPEHLKLVPMDETLVKARMSKEALRLKEEGNVCFREKRYHKAIELYTQSLQLEVTATVLANRAQSYLNLEEWAKAIMDCNRALEIDSKMEKVLYRRAHALEKVGLKASAYKDLKRCLEISPTSAVETMLKKLTGQLDAEVIDVPCVEKGDEIRSDSEFVEISVDIPRQSEEKVPKKEEPKEEIPAKVPNEPVHFGVPTTLRQFTKDYRELENLPPENFAKYFLSIPMSAYSALFGELMETDMITRLIRGLVPLLAASTVDPVDVSACLLHLADVPRFELLVMFLGDEEKRELHLICQHLTPSDAAFVREKFHIDEEE
ncbi:putative flagellar protein FliS [Oesophagostomum dentatum]|uniref:Exocyst complex component 5 n=1 Tax=Oesophagostomum dentatum TaxID=61180 RepID=A0A0B1T5B8_OESDE|nr:putative flagellar protein FliS [Oesophagostomum dentatum]